MEILKIRTLISSLVVFAFLGSTALLLAEETSFEFFNAKADPTVLQTFAVAGLEHPASATVYPAESLPEWGMPLGGIGTGFLCIDTDGRIGKVSLLNRYPAPLTFGSPLFDLVLDGKTYVLATPKNDVGDVKSIAYFGHFPVLNMQYELDVPLRIETRAFSPFILGDAVESNTPVAVFDVLLTNTSDKEQDIQFFFGPGGFPPGNVEPFDADGWAGFQTSHQPMEGLPAWIQHTYTLAVEGGKVQTESGARVFFPCRLKPGEKKKIHFLLAWNQPYLREGSGRIEKHFYSERFVDSQAVARHAIKNRESWLRRVLAWQDVIYGSDYPGWLQEELVNVLSTITKNSVWLAKTRPDDWWGSEGLFMLNESFATCPLMETLPCRYFGNWPQLFFFPELERTTLGAIREFQLHSGQPPFAFGMGFAIRDPRYFCQHTCGAGEYAQMIYRYYLRTGDEAFLKDFWRSARDSLDFMVSLDKDNDGLVEDHSHALDGEPFPANNPLDQWPWYGASSYTAGKGLASLACGVVMAEKMGDTEKAAQWKAIIGRGQKSYEEKLWTGKYYRTYNDVHTGRRNDACFSAQLSGLWGGRTLGIADVFPEDRVQSSLDSIMRLNVPASPFGMVDAVFEDGTICREGGPGWTLWSEDCFIQCNATTAMLFFYFDRQEEGKAAAKAMLDTIFRGPNAMPWSQPCGIQSKTGGSCHGRDYNDHMVVWAYPAAFSKQNLKEACRADGFIQKILDAAKVRHPGLSERENVR